MEYLYWGLLLVVQNASFTWVGRARVSGSDLYHGIAACFSNGIWFFAMFYTFDFMGRILESGSVALAVMTGSIYIVCTVTGSVSAGKFLRRYVEKGDKRVGAYKKGEG